MTPVEPTLQDLAAKFADSDEDEAQFNKVDETATKAQIPGATQLAHESLVHEQVEEDDDDEDWDYEDDWDSGDEAELAHALEWADLREGKSLSVNLTHMQARGNSGASSASFSSLARHPNAQGGVFNRNRQQQQQQQQQRSTALPASANNMQRLDARFSAGAVPNFSLSDDLADTLGGHTRVAPNAFNAVKVATANAKASNARGAKDRSDRATVEQVLDPRTRMVLFKMLNRGVFSNIHGCISTGKEANVYHASNGEGQELAIKVYKTAILVFKDRDRYVVGDSRFQRFCKSNPRKMVKMWAEKEMRNLARINASGIPCPKPIQLRMHILVMEFLGNGGVAAPKLKDANLPPHRMRRAYTEVVLMIRTLLQKCRLVHADLSEYNLLVHNGEVHMIDVSQSVELDHPRAFDFLRQDCLHVNDYFRRQGVATLTTKELFDFAVDPAIEDSNLDAVLDSLMTVATSRPIVRTAEEEVAEKVWAQAFIPKKLEEVTHYERDHQRLKDGKDTEGIYYQALAGMKQDMSGARTVRQVNADAAAAVKAATANGNNDSNDDNGNAASVSDNDEEESGSDYDSEESEGSFVERPKMSKEEIQAARKEHKKAVKAENAEKRKTKVKKHVKKRATKNGKKK